MAAALFCLAGAAAGLRTPSSAALGLDQLEGRSTVMMTARTGATQAGYLAGVQVMVTVVEFAVLGDLLLRLADRDMVGLEGPFWALRPDSAAYREARTEAVRDARRRAEEYAAAAGSRLTGLVEIADTGLPAAEVTSMAMVPARLFRDAAASVADEMSFDVQPVQQTVHASVEARFTATQPEFG